MAEHAAKIAADAYAPASADADVDGGSDAGPGTGLNAGSGADPGCAADRHPDTPGAVQRLPAGWTWRALRSLSLNAGRYGCAEPAHEYDPDLPRYVRITDVDERGALRADSRVSLPRAKAEPYRLEPGDLLFARSGTTVGKTYLYNPRDGECAHAGYLIRFSLDPERCVPAYVAQFTRSPAYWSWVARTSRQAAQPNINASEYGGLDVPMPPLDEQRYIADVLSACDRVIVAGEQIIDRLMLTKRALLYDLMTRGIDDNGAVRALSGETKAPKQSVGALPLPLPANWRVAPISTLLVKDQVAMRSGPFGSELKKKDLVSDGIPLLGIDNVEVDGFVAEYKRFVDRKTFRQLERYAVHPGDVMITIMGTVGRACVVPKGIGKALSSKHVWTLTFDPKRYIGRLACAQLNHAPWVRAHFQREEQGGTMNAIRSDTLRTTLLPVPPIEEQRRIAAVLDRCDERLQVERSTLIKHQLTKRGLMRDLFSGRRRVLR